MMTPNESRERVRAIWGEINATITQDSAHVMILAPGFAHRLDGNGHPTCHTACKELETSAYKKGLLK